MSTSSRAIVVLIAGTLMAASFPMAHAAEPVEALWEPHVGRAVDGSPIEGELGRIRVPESRSDPAAGTIELAFVRYRSTNPRPGPPIVFLAGGPGGSGVEGCTFVATHPYLRLLEHADVIGIDQRGTGLSRPDLGTPEFAYRLPTDRPIERKDEIEALREAVVRCVDYWADRGVTLGAYDTVESAHDIDAVRRALGAERITIYGASYGSHLGIAYLRLYPERVARAVLARVEGPDHTWKLPSSVQRGLEMLHARAAGDRAVAAAVPDLIGAMRRLLARLESEPVRVPLPVDTEGVATGATITLGAHDLRRELSRRLSHTRGAASIPALVHRMSGGDWSELAESAGSEREGSVHSAMAIMMDCASGASEARRARIERERRDPQNLLRDAVHAPFYPEVCAACGDVELGASFRESPSCDVPVLFVSGDLDVRTPPGNVEELIGGFSRAVHVIVENAAHDPRELISDEYRDLLQAFVRGERVESCTITLPFVFETIAPRAPGPAATGGTRAAPAAEPAAEDQGPPPLPEP